MLFGYRKSTLTIYFLVINLLPIENLWYTFVPYYFYFRGVINPCRLTKLLVGGKLMKFIKIILNIVFTLVILSTLFAAVSSAITKEPVLLTVIRSNSMYPVWQRGDMVIIENLGEKESVTKGDIVFFKSEEGSLSGQGWIAHRVIDGNEEQGFITKGDANEYTDQKSDGISVKREWIVGRAITIGDTPLVIPKIGYLSLWVEQFQTSPYLLPGIAVILAIIIGIGELMSGQKRRKKDHGMDLQLIYIVAGLTITVIMGATMLASAQKINLKYEVSSESQGVLMGSAVGIMKVGDEVSNPLAELSNGGFFKLIGSINTDDAQIKLSHSQLALSKGDTVNTTIKVVAEKPGKYDSSIQVGLFYPFLPSPLIYFLAEKSYWLALGVVSLVPGLPLMLYPVIDGKMRRKTLKVIRKRKNRLMSILRF